MNIVYLNRLDFSNPGDLWSTPYHYISKPGMLVDLFNPVNISPKDILIIGGGAILQNQRMINNLSNIFEYHSGIKIFWGGGIEENKCSLDFQKKFNFFGSRDWNISVNYLPCASVLHPIFQSSGVATKDFLIVDHWKRSPIEFRFEHTRMKNRFVTIEDIVNQIKKHRFVITSSYHAAYWGIILSKKVIVVSNPMQNKFNFEFNIPISEYWEDKFFDTCLNYDYAYDKCLQLNRQFYDRILNSGVF